MTSEEMSRNLEDFTIVWLDATLKTKNIADYVAKETYDMRQIINYVKLFIDSDSCIKYMTDPKIQNEKIFLVVSGSLGEDFIPRVHSTVKELYSIYVFCSYVEKHQIWAKNFNKIKGVYKDMMTICKQLRHDTIQCSNYIININIYSTKQETLFSYNELLKELQSMNTDETKKKFIDQCYYQYIDNENQLEMVNKFSMDYRPDQSIWWYERTDSFVYRILIKALRKHDMSILVEKLAFFIKDLHEQQLQKNKEKYYPLVVYRGFGLSAQIFHKFQRNKFMYVTNILVTNRKLDIARDFTVRALNLPDTIPVIFEIETMVADKEQEQVVFPINTIFIIRTIEKDNTGIQILRIQSLFI